MSDKFIYDFEANKAREPDQVSFGTRLPGPDRSKRTTGAFGMASELAGSDGKSSHSTHSVPSSQQRGRSSSGGLAGESVSGSNHSMKGISKAFLQPVVEENSIDDHMASVATDKNFKSILSQAANDAGT